MEPKILSDTEPLDTRPVHVGVYEINVHEAKSYYSKWDGVAWRTCHPNWYDASRSQQYSNWICVDASCFQWRGLAFKP